MRLAKHNPQMKCRMSGSLRYIIIQTPVRAADGRSTVWAPVQEQDIPLVNHTTRVPENERETVTWVFEDRTGNMMSVWNRVVIERKYMATNMASTSDICFPLGQKAAEQDPLL